MIAAAAATLGSSVAALAGVDPGVATAPRMEFVAPPPGSYVLQRIQPVAEADLLGPSGQSVRLSSVTTGKITLLTFFYTYCADPVGRPFAYQTLMDLRSKILRDAHLAQRVRFVSVSLDPTTDTPEAIGRYHDMLTQDGSSLEWDVLTARSVHDLLPVLDDFGQDVSVEQAIDGTPRRTVHHMLKMFLIDRTGFVREIYSLAFLQPPVMLNDLRSLSMEENLVNSRAVARISPGSPRP
jgi:protein SCO1